MKNEKRRLVVSIVLVKDSRELLLVKKGGSWFLPDGKVETDETEKECLAREMSEELPGVSFLVKEDYGIFDGISPNSGLPMKVKVFLGDFMSGHIDPSREISNSRWANKEDIESLDISEISRKIISKLQQKGHL